MTVRTTIAITGLDAALRQLRELRLDALRQTVADVLDEIAKDAAVYPPELPNQRYVRTFKLRDGWLEGDRDVRLSGDTLTAALTNGVGYADEVMGDDQKAVFQDRWRTVDDLVDAWEDRVADRIDDALDQLVDA